MSVWREEAKAHASARSLHSMSYQRETRDIWRDRISPTAGSTAGIEIHFFSFFDCTANVSNRKPDRAQANWENRDGIANLAAGTPQCEICHEESEEEVERLQAATPLLSLFMAETNTQGLQLCFVAPGHVTRSTHTVSGGQRGGFRARAPSVKRFICSRRIEARAPSPLRIVPHRAAP
ncbi:hypothetical protein AAFF_G00163620 [Aldrovandia affinis]|uniref:Uncharacterized protein n=1 Tax=Aldrovandia affinis TaxID=143900 RepID=A0AAD7WX58_9TELE|nr:hypothetical protein AAFF_G00163620 [Aldrovandia affinis]